MKYALIYATTLHVTLSSVCCTQPTFGHSTSQQHTEQYSSNNRCLLVKVPAFTSTIYMADTPPHVHRYLLHYLVVSGGNTSTIPNHSAVFGYPICLPFFLAAGYAAMSHFAMLLKLLALSSRWSRQAQ